MIQVDEYAVAIFFWAASAIVIIAKAITWPGMINRPTLTALGRWAISAAAVALFGFMIVWTAAKRSDKSWSVLTSPRAQVLPTVSRPTVPDDSNERAKAAVRKKAEGIIGDLLGNGDAAQAIYTQATRGQVDSLSAIQRINRWRGEAGAALKKSPFKRTTAQYVLTQTGNLIDEPLLRLRDVLAHLDQWLDFAEPELPKLYYGDGELNEAMIALEHSNPDPRLCTTMHVWRTMPTGSPDSFALCGAWMKKPSDEPGDATLYIAFSTRINATPGSCQPALEPPEPKDTYKVGYACRPGFSPSETKWILAPFFGEPIPTQDTRVRFRLFYGKSRVAEADFTLRPPAGQ